MRAAWLDTGPVDPDARALRPDDPGVRYGEGLFETMLATDGAVPWLERHLARMERSGEALGLELPATADIARAAGAVAGTLGAGAWRVRITVTPHPTLLVEGGPIPSAPDGPIRAASLRGAWLPGRALAEHKTLSHLDWRDAERRAAAAGADTALLLDGDGRLGEAATANVFCVVDGALVTAPARGLLPGIARAVVMERFPVREAALDEAVWRAADEMFLTNALRGVVSVGSCDGRTIGSGTPGPLTRRVAETLREGRAAAG